MNNESAFPVPDCGHGAPYYSGMTLRDYFAAAALTGLVAHPASDSHSEVELSCQAYNLAEAMLKERT